MHATGYSRILVRLDRTIKPFPAHQPLVTEHDDVTSDYWPKQYAPLCCKSRERSYEKSRARSTLEGLAPTASYLKNLHTPSLLRASIPLTGGHQGPPGAIGN
jgi:hypothetical protein